MSTIAEKLAYVKETKALIKSALIEKGQTVSDTDTFRSYAEKILAIEGGGDPVLQEKTATENGVVLPDEGYGGLSKVIVAVESSGGGEPPVWDGTDLTGTTWLLNNVLEPFPQPGHFGLVGAAYTDTHILGGNTFLALLEGYDEPTIIRLFENIEKYFEYNPERSGWTYYYDEYDDELDLTDRRSEQITNLHFTICGGDVTNLPFVIDWFKQNGTLISVGGSDPVLQEKTATENGEVTPDEGYDGLSKVIVNVAGEVIEEYDGTITVV